MSEYMRPLTELEKQALAYVRTHPGRTFEDCMAHFKEQELYSAANALAYLIANFYIHRDAVTNALTAAEWSIHHE